MKRLSCAHQEDDDGDADDDDDAFFSRAKFDGVVSALFYYTRPGKVSVFFCSKQQAKRRKIVTLQISLLNEISFPRKALFRLFVSSADREPPDGIKKLQGWISHKRNHLIFRRTCHVLKRMTSSMTSSMTSIYSVTHIFCAFAFVQAREALLGV